MIHLLAHRHIVIGPNTGIVYDWKFAGMTEFASPIVPQFIIRHIGI